MLEITTHKTYMRTWFSPMHFDNTKPFLDCVRAMVNDVMVTNKVNISEQQNVEA